MSLGPDSTACMQLRVDLGFGGEPVFDFVAGGESALLGAEEGCLGDQRRALFGTDETVEVVAAALGRSSRLAGRALPRSRGGRDFSHVAWP